jgi:Zn-dependent metalloprotease
MTRVTCRFIPPYLLRRLAEADDACARTLAVDEQIRTVRSRLRTVSPPPAEGPAWTVHSAGNTETLPGEKVRSAGEPESGDPAVDEAAEGVAASLALFAEVYDRDSYDGKGHPVSLTVHYGRDYANAFWDGTQLVFGDGDGRVFERFTKPVDVLGHEFTHAVTEHTAALVYENQPGALNESMSDVFAACLKQRLLGQEAGDADWLIGEGLFRPGVQARALRDMAAPGTAYDDPVLGKDPQVGHLDDYVETTDDNGGVHLNSGIPNRAFQLAATEIGGRAWEGAGRIWYAALTGDRVGADTDFAGFAAATIAAAGDHADAVRGAWQEVGVAADGARRRVRVRRTGGFIGRPVESTLELADDDPRSAEVAALLDRVEPGGLRHTPQHPDRFSYEFDLDGRTVSVREQDLTDDLRRIADLVLNANDR